VDSDKRAFWAKHSVEKVADELEELDDKSSRAGRASVRPSDRRL
jgi:hypothetical protein